MVDLSWTRCEGLELERYGEHLHSVLIFRSHQLTNTKATEPAAACALEKHRVQRIVKADMYGSHGCIIECMPVQMGNLADRD
jgi:hypothetical protein